MFVIQAYGSINCKDFCACVRIQGYTLLVYGGSGISINNITTLGPFLVRFCRLLANSSVQDNKA